MNRRSFLDFLGKASAGSLLLPVFITGCETAIAAPVLQGISPSAEDGVKLAQGLNHQVMLKWGDAISPQATFGFNNDYTAFLPDSPNDPNKGILWVNHESVSSQFVSGYMGDKEKTQAQAEEEMRAVGGSIVHIEKTADGQWELSADQSKNFRVDGLSPIPFLWPEPVMGSDVAIGTLANCSGGITPWGTILTCEENYDSFYGERDWEDGSRSPSTFGWEQYYDHPPEHYGWVVEVNLQSGSAQKLVALGRCAHECATVAELGDGRIVVYTGDDANDQCLYKFVSSEPGSLEKGTLYVASIEQKKWLSLDYDSQAILQSNFKDQTEVLIRLREAAALIGGSPLARPEDIDINPENGEVLVSLTNNIPKGNYYGEILKLVPAGGDHASLDFESTSFLAGGEETAFACPDNLAFDPQGNLWFTSDISGSKLNKPPYEAFKNNGLYMLPSKGPSQGKVLQMASAPADAEFTGPFFSPDGRTLFLSVQHPGELSHLPDRLTSHWPEGGEAIPRPSVIAITGPVLDYYSGALRE